MIGYSYLGDTSINSLQVSLQILRVVPVGPLSELLGRVQHGDPCAEHNSGSSSATARGWRSIASTAWFRFAMGYMVYHLFAYVLTVEALSICKPQFIKAGQRTTFCVLDIFSLCLGRGFSPSGAYFDPFKCQWHQEYSTFVRSLCSFTAMRIRLENRIAFLVATLVSQNVHTCDELR